MKKSLQGVLGDYVEERRQRQSQPSLLSESRIKLSHCQEPWTRDATRISFFKR